MSRSTLRLAGCWKRPSSFRAQSGLSRRAGRRSRRFRSRFFRGFLRSRFFCYLFSGSFLGRSLFSGSFLGRRFFSRYLFCWCFFSRYLFCRCFFSCYLFCRCFFSCYLFCRCFFSCYLFCRCFLWSSFFSRSFFRSCHSFLLDHVAISTSRLEYVKRFMALGSR